MKILYGTTNAGKLASMGRITRNLGLELIGLKELDRPIPAVEESGNDPLENARIKAEAYFNAFGLPVFSCDSGLYFDGLPHQLQPGTHIRRVRGRELTDEEMIAYYASLAAAHGGTLIGRYRNAIHLILDEQTHYSSMDLSLSSAPFALTCHPHPKRVAGFPLDALTVDPASGTYYYDMEDNAGSSLFPSEGFLAFFRSVF